MELLSGCVGWLSTRRLIVDWLSGSACGRLCASACRRLGGRACGVSVEVLMGVPAGVLVEISLGVFVGVWID